MNTLFEFEKKFKNLVEEKIVSLFVKNKIEDLVTRKLAFEMFENTEVLDDGTVHAPNFFLIITSPSNNHELKKNPDFVMTLAEALKVVGDEAGLRIPSKIAISVHEEKTMRDETIKVVSSFLQDFGQETRSILVKRKSKNYEEGQGPAYLILEGKQTIPLNLQVTNLGRRTDNQVVIDDPRVSRIHAQIREINGEFTIFDLNSKGGTYINGQSIANGKLKTGDVVSFAGVSMVFIQEFSVRYNEIDETIPSKP
ncbi:FHA domain-containing protein [Chloroflexota bacterium]